MVAEGRGGPGCEQPEQRIPRAGDAIPHRLHGGSG